MKKLWFRKAICLLLSVTALFSVISFSAFATASTGGKRGTNRDTAASLLDMQSLVGVSSYSKYLEEHGCYYIVERNGEKKEVTAAELRDGEKVLAVKPKQETAGLEIIPVDIVNGMITDSSNAQTPATNDACVLEYNKSLDDKGNPTGSWKDFVDNAGIADPLNNTLYLPAQGETTWSVEVPASGYYHIRVEYFSVKTEESSISSIERKLLIDGLAPFGEVSTITFDKNWAFQYVSDPVPVDPDTEIGVSHVWKKSDVYTKTVIEYQRNPDGSIVVDANGVKQKQKVVYTITQDIIGNSMLPEAVEVPTWSTYYCQDSKGYEQEFLSFYFLNGTHQITLASEREPVIIKSIELIPYEYDGVQKDKAAEVSLPSYSEFVDAQKEKHEGKYAPAGGDIITLEAEFPDLVSDSSVYATNDNSSAANFPTSHSSQKYNVIGENSYNAIGQWAAYKFTVTQSGTYKIAMRYKQSALQGMFICRTILLSGGEYGMADGTPTAPFAEAYQVRYDYDDRWQSNYLGDGNTEFEFYFEEDVEYTVYFECSLGSLKDYIKRVEDALNSINASYLSVLQLTGNSPDEYRDYKFLQIIPDDLRNFILQAKELHDVKNELEELCGTNGSHIATLETIYKLVDKMGQKDGDDIAANMSNLKSYLGTLGTWVNDSKKGTLIVDNISICPSDSSEKALPKAKAGIFGTVWHEIVSFIYSFFIKYDNMGLTSKPSKDTVSIDVWLASGRDQSNIWRTMIDATEGFTGQTGYGVNLKLVTGGTLLPSILARKGPDVYMGLGSGDVINYAIRDAVLPIAKIDGAENKYTENFDNNVYNHDHTVFEKTTYTYYYMDGNTKVYEVYDNEEAAKQAEADGKILSFTSKSYKETSGDNYVQAANDTLELMGLVYGVPQTMSFAMMFYRMDVLAAVGQEVPETWDQLLEILPVFQSNNMEIGVNYIAALDYMIYQSGGSMWKYEDDPDYAGAKVDLDSDLAVETFEFTCRLYTDYSFPVSFDAANRFRTGEMPIVIGDYISIYNTLTVYATEIDGLWSLCPLPGSYVYDDQGKAVLDEEGNHLINYNSLAGISATVILDGCKNEAAAWAYMQWQTSAKVQSDYGNKMVALIGPSAKYEAANKNAIKDLSWTATERAAIEDQMAHLSSIVNYPGSYILARYMKFAFLEAVNDKTSPADALSQYIETMNMEISRKREEFGLPTGDPPYAGNK